MRCRVSYLISVYSGIYYIYEHYFSVIPLPSVISKHFKRTEYIVKDWTGKLGENDNPGNHGWIQLKNDEWSFEIQDNEDPYYKDVIEILKGCSCKSICKKCKCQKSKERANVCTPISCKKCLCFQREANETEDSTSDISSSSDQSDSGSDSDRFLEYLQQIYPDQFMSDDDDEFM